MKWKQKLSMWVESNRYFLLGKNIRGNDKWQKMAERMQKNMNFILGRSPADLCVRRKRLPGVFVTEKFKIYYAYLPTYSIFPPNQGGKNLFF